MTIRDLFIRLGGHDPITMRNEGREATQPIAMAGSTVLMAAMVTSANWAIASHALADDDTSVGALIATVIGAALGFLLVATLDRAGIYQIDTHSGRGLPKAALLLVRLILVLLVSTVTTGAIAPVLLKPELEAHALEMREQSELSRMHMLDKLFSTEQLQMTLKQNNNSLTLARAATGVVPPDVLLQQNKSKSCWQSYAVRKAELVAQAEARLLRNAQSALQRNGFYQDGPVDGIWGPRTASAVLHFQQARGLPLTGQLDQRTLVAFGIDRTGRQAEDGARDSLKGLAADCNSQAAAARRAQDAYESEAQNALHHAESQHAAASSAFSQAQKAISTRIAQANVIESEAISPQSATVLASLLASDPGARSKWYGVYGFITCLELLPLLLKTLSDRSAPGVRIAVDRDIALVMHERRRIAAYEDQQREMDLRAAMDFAMNEALSSGEIREQAIKLFQSKIGALVPIEIAKRLFAEIEAGAREAETAMRCHPDYAKAIGEAWSRAMEEVCERLRAGAAHVQI